MSKILEGACLCGAVQFTIETPSKFVGHCHCSICRRAHGAPFVTWVGVKNDQFQLTKGKEYITRYQSSPEAIRSFCKKCGSPLFFESLTRWKGEIHIAASHIKGDLDRKPQAHFFCDDKANWLTITDDLPRFGGKTGTEPLS